MKKFKTRKEILENPEFRALAYELLLEEIDEPQDGFSIKDDIIESKLKFFIERKIQQCKYQGV